MRRRLFTLAAALSSILCVALTALWVRSYFVRYSIVYQGAAHEGRYPFARMDVQVGLAYWMSRVETFPPERDAEFVHVVGDGNPHLNLLQPSLRYEAVDPFDGIDSPAPSRFQPRFLLHFFWRVDDVSTKSLTHTSLAAPLAVREVTRQYRLPLWVPALVFAIAPLIWLRRERSTRRLVREGRCLRCGYDLRATRDRCPECGEVPPGTNPVTATV